jgi:hypothetical protein
MAASLAGLVRQATSSITGGFAREDKEIPGWEPYPEAANSSRAPRAPAAPREAPPPIPPRVQATLRAAAHPAATHIGAAPSAQARPDPRAKAAATVDPARAAVSPVQYLRELDGFSRGQSKAEIAKAVLTVTATEIESAIHLSARLRGRYLARVLDAAQAGSKRPFGEAESKELARMREMSEEMQRGVEALKRAIESGDLNVPGLRAQ